MGAESAARRERVLRYPDLAKRLTEPPLGYKRPQDWSGWVPPATGEVEACPACQSDPGKWGCKRPGHHARANNSRRRAALVEIAAEALAREDAAAGAAAPESRGTDGI